MTRVYISRCQAPSKVLFREVLLSAAPTLLVACGTGTNPPALQVAPPVTAAATATVRGEITGAFKIDDGEQHLRVDVLAADTVRLRFFRGEERNIPASFAVDPALGTASAPHTLETGPAGVTIRTSVLGVRLGARVVDKTPVLNVALLDERGEILNEGAAPVVWQREGFRSSWSLARDALVFGLGDKAKGFDRRGQLFEFWNTDAYGWKPDADPLYKSIPFFLFMDHGRAHGLFFDTPARAQVDVGKTDAQLLHYAATTGESLDLYLLAGPDPKRVVSAFSALTGRTPLPPRWALGYHQSRYSYLTEREARGVATRLRTDAIPTDALWLDIDYQQDNAPFTVDPKTYPNLPGMVADLRRSGMRVVLITDPHIKSYQGKKTPSGYAPYDTGAAGDHFLRDAQNGFLEAKVWPGASVFPEFTRAKTRLWWGDLYRDFVTQGVAGFWNDMNEPASLDESKTLPPSALHRLDDDTTLTHAFVHNAYGSLNAQATFEGLSRLRPNERPFVLTRAAYSGTQRFAATWTGDNSATREHLALSIAQLANLGVSGYAFAGADVGGFVGCPDEALLVEWTELGSLQPFFRNHSGKDTCRREPWVHGAVTEARVRKAIERRYRLLPYLYTLFEEASRSGLPVVRPMWLEYPDDPAIQRDANSYLLGADLLVAPKLVPGEVGYVAQLPRGAWYDTLTEALIANGGAVPIPASNDSVRIFARAGAIIPQQPLIQHTDQTPKGALQLDLWPGERCVGSLYLDDGQSLDYRSGAFQRVSYACRLHDHGIDVSAHASGQFANWWSSTKLIVHGVQRGPSSVVDGQGSALNYQYDAEHHRAVVHLPGPSSDWSVRLRL
ncbi:MAG TPA: TIM-barrel domain-containing protein [Polyangiaceae bacterium]|nr:TIM-barrel domain-containing protein [Polyangiaceae bacterium]